jgi:hypothetical protein
MDFALYVNQNLAGLEGQAKLSDRNGQGNINSIHLRSKASDMYVGLEREGEVTLGYGWVVIPVNGGNLSAAHGSDGTLYATVVVYPALDAGFAGFTNCGDGSPGLADAMRRITGIDVNSHRGRPATHSPKTAGDEVMYECRISIFVKTPSAKRNGRTIRLREIGLPGKAGGGSGY